MIGVVAAVPDEDRQPAARFEVRPPPLDGRDEAGEREDPGRPGRSPRGRARSSSPSPSRSRRAPCAPGRARSAPTARRGTRRARVRRGTFRVGIADPRHDVPVYPGQPGSERRARGDDVQAPRGSRTSRGEQVVLVRAAAVMQHEQAGGLALRRPLANDHACSATGSLVPGRLAGGRVEEQPSDRGRDRGRRSRR